MSLHFKKVFFVLFALTSWKIFSTEVGLLFVPSDLEAKLTTSSREAFLNEEEDEEEGKQESEASGENSDDLKAMQELVVEALKKSVARNGASLVESGTIICSDKFTKSDITKLVELRVAQVQFDLISSNEINFESDVNKDIKQIKKNVKAFRAAFIPEEELDRQTRWARRDVTNSEDKETPTIDFFMQSKNIDEAFLLFENESEGFEQQFNSAQLIYVLEDILFVKKVSVTGSIQIIIYINLALYNLWDMENLKEAAPIEIIASGFNEDQSKAVSGAIEVIPKQLIRELSQYVIASGELAIVELIKKNEVVVSCGYNQDIFVGQKLVVTAPVLNRDKSVAMGTKGILVVYKVEEDYAYCRAAYIKRGEALQIGDRIKIEKQVGLLTDVYISFLGGMNKEADYDSSSLRMSSGVSQLPDNASYFSEMVGLIGIRETVLHGCYLVRPFFGIDLFIDGVSGSGTSNFNPEKLFYLGNLEGEGFLYRKDMLGLLRPYVGFNINWHLNRVTLSPELAFGFIFNKRVDFDGDPSSVIGSSSGTDYNPIPGSGFNYFTVSSALNISVVLTSRFNFICNIGYEKWLGNLVELKGKISPVGQGKGDAQYIDTGDFIKFFDWQYLKFGVGFSVSY